MTLSSRCQPLEQTTVDAFLVPVFTDDISNPQPLIACFPVASERLLNVLGTAEMRGKPGQILALHLAAGSSAGKLVLMGMGAAEKLTTQTIRESVAAAIRTVGPQKKK